MAMSGTQPSTNGVSPTRTAVAVGSTRGGELTRTLFVHAPSHSFLQCASRVVGALVTLAFVLVVYILLQYHGQVYGHESLAVAVPAGCVP